MAVSGCCWLLQDVSCLLDVSRAELGVMTSPKGVVAGQLFIQRRGETEWRDCSGRSRTIPGDCLQIQGFSFRTEARLAAVIVQQPSEPETLCIKDLTEYINANCCLSCSQGIPLSNSTPLPFLDMHKQNDYAGGQPSPQRIIADGDGC